MGNFKSDKLKAGYEDEKRKIDNWDQTQDGSQRLDKTDYGMKNYSLRSC